MTHIVLDITDAEAAHTAAAEGVAPEATDCPQYSLVAGAWVCTSGH